MALEFRLSGGTANTNPNGSIGNEMSTTAITTDVLENLFDNIKRNEALVGKTEYRKIFIYNTGPGTVTGITLEVSANPDPTIVSIGLDSAGKGDGVNTGVGTTIATEDTTPTGVKFFGEDALSSDGPYDTVILPIGHLRSGEAVPVWLKRVTETGAQQVITLTLKLVHDAVTLPGEDYDDGGAIGELMSVKILVAPFRVGTAKVGESEVGS